MIDRVLHAALLVLLALVLLSGCGPSEPEGPPPLPTLPGLDEAPGRQVRPCRRSYPAAEVVAPAVPTRDPDYPAPPTFAPTVDPYPGGLVWVIRP